MQKAKCIAIAEDGRINLIISKKEKGYEEFKKILDTIDKKGIFSWYGDVEDLNGNERSGLVISTNISTSI